MNWLDIIGMGVTFPTTVVLISYLLTREDKKIESLHSQIINRLLSFRGKAFQDELSMQTIKSLSLEESLYEIDKALGRNLNIKKEGRRIDIEYDIYPPRQAILKDLKNQVRIQKREKVLVLTFLIFLIIIYILIKNGTIKI